MMEKWYPLERKFDLAGRYDEGGAQRENDRREERGIWGGALEENRGPHLTAVLQPADRRFVSCTEARPEPFTAPPSHFLPSAASSPSLVPAHVWTPFTHTPRLAPSASNLHRMAGPK